MLRWCGGVRKTGSKTFLAGVFLFWIPAKPSNMRGKNVGHSREQTAGNAVGWWDTALWIRPFGRSLPVLLVGGCQLFPVPASSLIIRIPAPKVNYSTTTIHRQERTCR